MLLLKPLDVNFIQQECIPVGWILPTAVAMGGLPQCMLGYTPLGVGLETPPSVGLETPLGVDLETPPGQTPQLPPWVWAWRPPLARPLSSPWVWAWKPARHAGIPPTWRPAARHAGIPAAMHAGILPPCEQND